MSAFASQVAALTLYFLKSGKPAEITDHRIRVKVTSLGFEGDREFMLIDPVKKVALTQREQPLLTRLRLIPMSKSIILFFDGESVNQLLREDQQVQTLIVDLHEEDVRVREVDSSLSDWISERFGQTVMLVRKEPKFGRQAGFQDARAFQLISKATIDDVVSRTGSEIPRLSLRPNLVVDGVAAYAEDGWNEIAIGQQRFRLEPCPRCVVPTIDQATGVSLPAINKTLAGYRMGQYRRPNGELKPKILLGRYMTPVEPFGAIGVGDEVTVIS